jgi:hypothetical protein
MVRVRDKFQDISPDLYRTNPVISVSAYADDHVSWSDNGGCAVWFGGLLGRTSVPTLAFMLSTISSLPWLRFMGLAIGPLLIALWWPHRDRRSIDMPDMVITTLLISVLTTPFAWSFDALILLVTLQRLVVWAVENRISSVQSLASLALFMIVSTASFYQRSQQAPERHFFWVPAAVGILYLLGLVVDQAF